MSVVIIVECLLNWVNCGSLDFLEPPEPVQVFMWLFLLNLLFHSTVRCPSRQVFWFVIAKCKLKKTFKSANMFSAVRMLTAVHTVIWISSGS